MKNSKLLEVSEKLYNDEMKKCSFEVTQTLETEELCKTFTLEEAIHNMKPNEYAIYVFK